MGRLGKSEEFVIESLMATGAVAFSYGIETDSLEFNGGSIARLTVAEETGDAGSQIDPHAGCPR